jgi:hypothetical protein
VRITNRDIWDSLQGLSGKLSDALRAFATHTAVAAGQVTDLQDRVHVLEGKVQVLEVASGKQEDLPDKVDELGTKVDQIKSSLDKQSWMPGVWRIILTAVAGVAVGALAAAIGIIH